MAGGSNCAPMTTATSRNWRSPIRASSSMTISVFALIGAVGTPTSAAAEPIAAAAGVPFIAPFTGAEFLRDPALTNVVNIRASYSEETETIVERLVDDLGISRIGVLYQDDSYGRSGLAGVQAGARTARPRTGRRRSLYAQHDGRENRAAWASSGRIREAIIIVGAYLPSARVHPMGAQARRRRPDPQRLLRRQRGARGSARAGRRRRLHHARSCRFPRATRCRCSRSIAQALVANDATAQPSFGSLEGYIAGRLTAEVLARAGETPDPREFPDGARRDRNVRHWRLRPEIRARATIAARTRCS